MNLITGATGLLGSYLAKLLLSKGEKVRAIKRATSDVSLLGEYASKIEWVEADVLDYPALEQALAGVERLYHCAAVISFMPAEYDDMAKVNVEGTANVMNAALHAGVKKVMHVSSVAAFGLPTNHRTIDEKYSDPNISKCFAYFKSKHYAEREAWRANAEGLDVVVVCPSTIIGAGWWDDEPNSLFKTIDNGLQFYTTATNGFVDVRDVVECMYLLMLGAFKDERYIISAQNESFKNLIWQIADTLNVARPKLEAGSMLREVAWRLEGMKSIFSHQRPLVTKHSAQLAGINFTYSNQKVIDALGYRFRPLEQTIRDTANAYLQSKKSGKNYGVFI
ncbi:MAG: SDR family NAD(P)-dependent oxidoreductase [Chitinophagales bacterium]|nr:SDR family NAD(P)-dependent oxidoreductase [Chitinophagales bacterium]